MRPLPSFFIVCGDLVDAMPDQWPDIRKEQEKDFLKIYSDLDPEIPLGNAVHHFLPFYNFNCNAVPRNSMINFLNYYFSVRLWKS